VADKVFMDHTNLKVSDPLTTATGSAASR